MRWDFAADFVLLGQIDGWPWSSLLLFLSK
jgi:hypothetical protein